MQLTPKDRKLAERWAIVLISSLAALVWSLLQVQVLYPVLKRRCGWDIANLDAVFMLLPVAGAFALSPKLRRLFPIRLTWTWVSLIPLCGLLINLAFLGNPDGISVGFPMASLIIEGFATGFKEEFFFRGLAFIRGGESTPRDTVLLTAVCFSLMHLLNFLSGQTERQVEFAVCLAFAYGLSFGVIRVATGSIAWGVLIHGAVDATVPFAKADSRTFEVSAALFMLATSVAGFILLYAHPSMRNQTELKS
jgi:membrane protease YdiL (CAAX protease family)